MELLLPLLRLRLLLLLLRRRRRLLLLLLLLLGVTPEELSHMWSILLTCTRPSLSWRGLFLSWLAPPTCA